MQFRPYQKEVIDAAVKGFNKFDNVIIDAPTGFGKSIVAYLIAKQFKSCWYTTPQTVLLDQLENDNLISGGITIIKGRDKYVCPISKTPCNTAPCINPKFLCYYQYKCPYEEAKTKALLSRITAMSFAFMILTKDIQDWGQRELLIVDEADDIESWAVDFSTVTIQKTKAKNIKEILEEELIRTKAKIRQLEENITPQSAITLENLRKHEYKIKLLLDEDQDNYAYQENGNTITIKPIYVNNILNKIIWNRGKKRLIMSATIINPKLFIQYTGLKGKTLYIKVPSIIPKERRPIYIIPSGKMTKNERLNSYDNIVNQIEKISEIHKNEKGLIHCHSYEIAEQIISRLKLKRKIITHNHQDREEKFKEFLQSNEPSIFISVGFSRGIDLKYDACRWQIITKIPYPDISDPRVKEIWIKRKNWKWARYQAIKTLIQMCGRIVRAEDDYGVTYILDSSIQHLLKYQSEFPDWFLESIKYDAYEI